MRTFARRRGFTLPEVLVTVTIVAVLAAVVVPAVLNQIGKGDSAALSSDVNALRTAISNFTTDTRHYPASIEDLNSAPLAADLDLLGVPYGQAAIDAWKGPYFPTGQQVSSTVDFNTSSFGLSINNTFLNVNNYLALEFENPSAALVAQIDQLFDNGDGTVPVYGTLGCTPATAGSTTGLITWSENPGSGTGATDPCSIANLRWRVISIGQ